MIGHLPRSDIDRVFAWGKHRACIVTETDDVLVWTMEENFSTHSYIVYEEPDTNWHWLSGMVCFVRSNSKGSLHLLSFERGSRILEYDTGKRLYQVVKQGEEYVNQETGEVYRDWNGGSEPTTDLLLYTERGEPFWFSCRGLDSHPVFVTRPVRSFPLTGIDEFDILIGCKVKVPFKLVSVVDESGE